MANFGGHLINPNLNGGVRQIGQITASYRIKENKPQSNDGIYAASTDAATDKAVVGALGMFDTSDTTVGNIPRLIFSLNGMGAEELRLADGDVDLALQLLRMRLKPAFIASTEVTPGTPSAHVLQQGVAMGVVPTYLDDPSLRVGDLVAMDFRNPRTETLENIQRYRATNQIGSWPAVLVKHTPGGFAQSYVNNLLSLLEPANVGMWNSVMRGDKKISAAQSWYHATGMQYRSTLTSGLLMVYWMIKQGLLQVNGRHAELVGADGSQLPVNVIVARLFQYMGLTKKQDRAAAEALSRAGGDRTNFYKKLRYDLLKVVYHQGGNRFYEFGSGDDVREGGAATRTTENVQRDGTTKRVFSKSIYGEIGQLQIDNVRHAASAFATVYNFDASRIVGRLVAKEDTLPGKGQIFKTSVNLG